MSDKVKMIFQKIKILVKNAGYYTLFSKILSNFVG